MAFAPKSVTLFGGFELQGPIGKIFPLFSPLGEKLWVPGWDPEILFPPGAQWEEGMVFRTREELGDAVWHILRLDPIAHEVSYVRVESNRYLARVTVRCEEIHCGMVGVKVSYTFIGLTERGNADILEMSRQAYEEKMARWRGWIEAILKE